MNGKKKCTHIYSFLPSIETKIRHGCLLFQELQMFCRNPISHPAFFFFKPIPDQWLSCHCLMPPFLGYYHLPSLWSNYFSTQISAVFFLTLGFLQPISMFYWCKIKLHSVPWFSPCSPLAHKISVIYRPTIFSPAPWACFEVLRNLDLPSLFTLIYYYPLWTLTSSHTWLFEGFRIFSPVLLLFLLHYYLESKHSLLPLEILSFFQNPKLNAILSMKTSLIILNETDASFLWIPESGFSLPCMWLMHLRYFVPSLFAYKPLSPTFFFFQESDFIHADIFIGPGALGYI